MARRKKVLVVDDERDLVELIGLNLVRNGYEVISAHDGATGLDMARKLNPDLIVLDVMMPGLSGRNASVKPAEAVLSAGPVVIDHSKHEVRVQSNPVNMTQTEFKLHTALFQGGGRVLSRDQLMDRAMGADVFVTDRAIDVHITAA